MNDCLHYKCELNVVNLINQTVWTLQDGFLKPYLFNAKQLHLIKEDNGKLSLLIYKATSPDIKITKSVPIGKTQ